MRRPRLTRARAGLVLVLFAAALLRLWGVPFGLPHRYHMDEPFYVVGALHLGQGDFHLTVPHNTPNLWQFILLAEYGAIYVLGRIAGWFANPADLARLYTTDPTIFYLAARATSAAMGVATVGLVYALGRRVQGERVGLIAGALFAVSFLPVRDAHYAVNDAFVVLLTTACCYAAAHFLDTGDRRVLAMGWLAWGAATGMKYRPAAFGLALAVAMVLVARRHGLPRRALAREGLTALLAGAAGFVIGFPGVILNTEVFLFHLRAAASQAGQSFEGWVIDAAPAWLYYLRALDIGAGAPLLAVAALGLVVAARGRRVPVLLIAASAGAYFLSISLVETYFVRYALPVFPVVALLGAIGIESLASRVARLEIASPEAAAGAALALCSVWPLAASLRHDQLLTETDTRTLAKAWIETNLPEGARIALDWPIHGPPLATREEPEPRSLRAFEVLVVIGKGLGEHPIAWYREQKIDYLVTTSYIRELDVLDPELRATRRAFYAELDREHDLRAEFAPYPGARGPALLFDDMYGPITSLWAVDRPGPTLRVYRIASGL